MEPLDRIADQALRRPREISSPPRRLSSQTGEATDTRSERRVEGSQLNIDSAVGFKAPGFSKADLGSRYQTSNSSTLQTSRKATVRSWFGELHRIEGLRVVEPGHDRAAAIDAAELLATDDTSVIIAAGDLRRGAFVEFKYGCARIQYFILAR